MSPLSRSVESIPFQGILRCWKHLAQELYNDLIYEQFVLILLKMYNKRELKKPLDVVVMLGDEGETCHEMIKFILEKEDHDTEVWVPSLSCNLTPLDLAALFGFSEVVKKLMERNDFQVPETFGFLRSPIHYAVLNGHLETVKLLVEVIKDPLDGSKYCSPIHLASRNGHLDTLKYLVNFTNNPNARDNCGQTPFHLAATAGSLECLEFLAERIKLDSNGETPINLVSNVETPINLDDNGKTPIHIAANYGHLDCLKFLVTFTDNPIAQDNYGRTPIHFAAQQGNLDCIKFLVEFTEAPNISGFGGSKSFFGKTPIELAQCEGHTEVVQFLEEYCKNLEDC